MNKQNILNEVLQEASQPVSNNDIATIVNKFSDVPANKLSQFISNPHLNDDFTIDFIKNHEHYIKLSNKSVHLCHNIVEDTNDNDEFFILIHGLGGSLEQFLPLLIILDKLKRKFLAIDLLGFGKSEELDQYTMSSTIESINEILSIVVPQGKKILNIIGHSMGCYLALQFFNKFNTNFIFSKLILLAPPGPLIKTLSKDNTITQLLLKVLFKWPQFFTFYREWFDQSKGLESSGIKSFFHDDSTMDPKDQYIRQYWKLFQFRNNITIKSRSLIGYLLGWESVNWEKINSALQDSNCKIFIICGDADNVTKIEVSKELYNSFDDKSKVNFSIIENCSHNICLDSLRQISQNFIDIIIQD